MSDFASRVERAKREGADNRPLLQIGDHVPADMLPVVEGVWSVNGRTIVETSVSSANPDVPLIDESYVVSTLDWAWFVVVVAPAPSSAERVRQFVGRLGFRVYWPRQVAMVMRGRGEQRKPVPVVTPLFPRYVLVHLPATNTPFGAVNSHEARFNGVTGLVSVSGYPLCVPDPLVERIVEREREGEFNATTKARKRTVAKLPDWLKPGAIVMLRKGPFANFPGVVETVDAVRGLARVAVSIFGRATPVEAPIAELGAMC